MSTANQEYQDYKIKVSQPSPGCHVLLVVGRTPNGINVNYKSIFEHVVSVCFQTHSDDTGVFHLIMNYKGVKHEFQFLLKDVQKNEHKSLYQFFIPYLQSEYAAEDLDAPRRASP